MSIATPLLGAIDSVMFKTKNTLPPLRDLDKKDPMLKTRFYLPVPLARPPVPSLQVPIVTSVAPRLGFQSKKKRIPTSADDPTQSD